MNPIDALNTIGSGALADSSEVVDGPVGQIITLGVGIKFVMAVAGLVLAFLAFLRGRE